MWCHMVMYELGRPKMDLSQFIISVVAFKLEGSYECVMVRFMGKMVSLCF